MPSHKDLLEQQAKVVNRFQREILEDSGVCDPDLVRCLTQAIDKYTTLAMRC